MKREMTDYSIPNLPLSLDLEDKPVLKQAMLAHQRLAELKGEAHTIPNELILINTLTLQEAMSVKRQTATKYLDRIVALGLLEKVKVGRYNYYINQKLVDLFLNHEQIGQ